MLSRASLTSSSKRSMGTSIIAGSLSLDPPMR